MTLMQLAEQRRLPDGLIRIGIRKLLRQRLRQVAAADTEESLNAFIAELKALPIAEATDKANEQHYELPPAYFERVLGPRLKYSSGYWTEGAQTLASSEAEMLRLTCARAQLQDGQRILELGCGWGSLTLWMAEHYPQARILAVSNSNGQRQFIMAKAAERGLSNVEVVTADMNTFAPDAVFDRIVSVEMFEHMKNYQELMARVASWLQPQGKLFVHIFTHRLYAYHFIDSGAEDDWMARFFFTGGTMPSDDLLLHFQEHLHIEGHWRVNGTHYSRTLEAWLALQDSKEKEILPVFIETYGSEAAARLWLQRWRIFYLACSELFRFRGGNEWMVSHYLFAPNNP